jgi:hypothetical protein
VNPPLLNSTLDAMNKTIGEVKEMVEGIRDRLTEVEVREAKEHPHRVEPQQPPMLTLRDADASLR